MIIIFIILFSNRGGEVWGNTKRRRKGAVKNVRVAEVADLEDVPVADAAAEAEEDEIWVAVDADVAVFSPVTEDLDADDEDEAAAVLDAVADPAQEATVGTVTPALNFFLNSGVER